MASSSTRSTWIEKQLRYYHKLAFTRLHNYYLMRYAELVNAEFAKALDMTESHMLATLRRVSFNPAKLSREDYEADVKRDCALNEENRCAANSSRIFWAGNALTEAGEALKVVGRIVEGEQFCIFGTEMWQMAQQAYNDEQHFRRGNGVVQEVGMIDDD